MKRILLLIITICFSYQTAIAQNEEERSVKYPAWTFHDTNVTIYGISIGAWTGKDRNTVTNGLRIELPGFGVLIPAANGTNIYYTDTITEELGRDDFTFSEVVNGINISLGSWGDLNYNGITFGLIGQNGYVANGIAFSGLINSINLVNGISIGGVLVNEALQHNGIQIGGIANSSIIMYGLQIAVQNSAKTMKGIQIGLINHTYDSTGIQIGLWNTNEHRSLPFINWSF